MIQFYIQFHIRLQFHIQFHIQCFNLLPDYFLLFGNFTPIPQIYIHRVTNLTEKTFQEISLFSRKTYIVCKIGTKMVLLRFRSVTPDYVTINQNLSPIPQIYILNSTILTKNNFWKYPSFPEKLTLCAKLGQKWSCLDFEVLPSDCVTINQNFSPIPQIYIPNTTILTEKKFWKISQFSSKTYISVQNWDKNGLAGILRCYPLIM